MISTNLFVILFLTSVLNVKTERGFDIIRQKHAINYLQYIGLIPGNIKCLKWGYKRTNFDLFKLEIVCLQELKVHDGTCPIWQDCQWYQFYNYFPITCLRDNDCDTTCKCCFSPCFGTLTCRPAINTQINPKPQIFPSTSSRTTQEMISTTEMPTTFTQENQAVFVTITTTTEEVDDSGENLNNTGEFEVPNELDYNNVLSGESKEMNAGPNVLHESEYEDSSQIDQTKEEEDSKSDNSAAQSGREQAKVTTTAPGFIRTTAASSLLVGDKSQESSTSTEELLEIGSGTDDRIHFKGMDPNVTDDEDFVREGSG